MLVFGDRERTADPRAEAAVLARAIGALGRAPAGLVRHGAITAAFLDASELAQGLADAAAAVAGRDAPSAAADAAMSAACALAAMLARSWDACATAGAGRIDGAAASAASAALARLAELAHPAPGAGALPDSIALRTAEGYAHYALYPEAYLAAARAAIAAAPGPRRVIGIRSIGTGLGAIVAAATGAPRPATLRPIGDPLRRRVAVADELAREWQAAASGGATIALADEGPGRSGSSFGAVVAELTAHGVPEARIELYPGHAGEPGPAADEAARARWHRLRRWPAADLAAQVAERALRELVGPLAGLLEDLSAGAWRAHHYAGEAAWPPVVAYQERRKFRARTGAAIWLARFAGLGRTGDHALARARELAAAGFGPDVAGLRHGFLVERWLEAASPLEPRAPGSGTVGAARGTARIDRRRLVEHVGRYLGFRRRAFTAEPSRGATLRELLEMARHNAALSLGPAAAAALDRWRPALDALEARARPIEVDARLHAWEWLLGRDGRLIKTDAVDHHAGHDLVGCQDVAWDLAGAIAELALSPAEARRLVAATSEAGPVDPELLAFLRPAYLAFQLGRATLAIDMATPAEATRLRAAAERYAHQLRALLEPPTT